MNGETNFDIEWTDKRTDFSTELTDKQTYFSIEWMDKRTHLSIEWTDKPFCDKQTDKDCSLYSILFDQCRVPFFEQNDFLSKTESSIYVVTREKIQPF